MQITRLPAHPNENEGYDLLSRWQGALSSLYAWGYRLLFLLLRHDGKTKLLGTTSAKQEISAEEAVEQLREICFGSMPGMGIQILDSKSDVWDEIHDSLAAVNAVGAVTGIPSFITITSVDYENSFRSLLSKLVQKSRTIENPGLAIRFLNKMGYDSLQIVLKIMEHMGDAEKEEFPIAQIRRRKFTGCGGRLSERDGPLIHNI